MLNDNALCLDGRYSFGTSHGMCAGDPDSGTVNAIFVDAHVEEVCLALGDASSYTEKMEFGIKKHQRICYLPFLSPSRRADST